MAECEIEVRLDEPGATYRAGDAIRGRVRVQTTSGTECRALAVTFEWRTHGQGNPATGPRLTRELFRGRWPGGTTNEYPFELTAPSGPATYHGTVLNVDHYVGVDADVDVPWALHPDFGMEVVIAPTPGTASYDHGPEHVSSAPPEISRLPDGGPAFLVILGLMLGAMTFMMGYFCFGMYALGVGLLCIPYFKKRATRRRFGEPRLSLSPDPARIGESVVVEVALAPTGDVTLTEGTLRLIGRERVRSRSGTDERIDRRDVHSAEHRWAIERTVRAGEAVTLRGTVPLPAYAGPTFAAVDNQLHWLVEVSIGVAGGADWKAEIPLTVRP
jgi:hypothetical protein